MKLFKKMKDGGPLSRVTGYWLIEIKSLFSIALLRFDNGSRDMYHNHAFNAISWVLSGGLREEHLDGRVTFIPPSWRPIHTSRDCFHKVISFGTTWVLTFRGRWSPTWKEYSPIHDYVLVLKEGRVVDKMSPRKGWLYRNVMNEYNRRD